MLVLRDEVAALWLDILRHLPLELRRQVDNNQCQALVGGGIHVLSAGQDVSEWLLSEGFVLRLENEQFVVARRVVMIEAQLLHILIWELDLAVVHVLGLLDQIVRAWFDADGALTYIERVSRFAGCLTDHFQIKRLVDVHVDESAELEAVIFVVERLDHD